MANPRRRSRTLRNFGAGGWPVGLRAVRFINQKRTNGQISKLLKLLTKLLLKLQLRIRSLDKVHKEDAATR